MAITLYKWSKVDLPDPDTYYGGYKEPRLLTAGQYMRALSDRRGQYETSTFDFTVSDNDRLVRGLLAGVTSRYLINKTVIIRTVSDEGRRRLDNARIVAIGLIRDYEPMAGLKFKFKCEDYAAKFIGSGRNPDQIPKRLITLAEFPNAPEEKKEDGGVDPADGVKTYTTPHPNVNTPQPTGFGVVRSLCSGYVQLSDQAAALNQTGTVSNGTYGLCGDAGPTGDPPTSTRGWIMYDKDGVYVEEGWPNHTPLVGGEVVFTSPDVAEVLEAAVGGTVTELAPTVGLPVPIIYGNMTDVSTSGAGQCPAIYVGSYTLPANGLKYHKFLVCGHAVAGIDALYTEDGTTGVADLTDTTLGAGLGGPWIVPGYGNWTTLIGANRFEDINGQRFTVIYGKAGHPQADVAAGFADPTDRSAEPISVAVRGIEAVGDGTGALITDLFMQYLHFMRNFAFAEYQSGGWNTSSPSWPHVTPSIEVINSSSFSLASAIAGIRFAGGYVGAGMFGGADGRISIQEAIRRFNISGDVSSGFNGQSQFFISMYDDAYSSTVYAHEFLQSRDIIEGTFTIRDSVTEWENKIVYSHTRLGMDREWKHSEQSVQDAVSIANYEETKASDTLEYWFVRNVAQAAEVAQRRLTRNKVPPRVVEFDTTLIGLNHDIGSFIGVTHIEGIGAAGWIKQPVYITRHVFDSDKLTVTLTGYDVGRLFSGASTLGAEGIQSATWGAASEVERQYFYLCDETTGLMGDGAPGKRLR